MNRLLLERTLGVVALLLDFLLFRRLRGIFLVGLPVVILLGGRRLYGRVRRRDGRGGATASSGAEEGDGGEKEGSSQEREFHDTITLTPRQAPENTYFISPILGNHVVLPYR